MSAADLEAAAALGLLAGEHEVLRLQSMRPLLEVRCRTAAVGHPERHEVGRLVEALLAGYRGFAASGRTPHDAYVAMRRLSYITDGHFNAFMRHFYASVHPPRFDLPAAGVLGDPRAVGTLAREVEAHGVCVLPARVPEAVCAALRAYALEIPCRLQSRPLSPPSSCATTPAARSR